VTGRTSVGVLVLDLARSEQRANHGLGSLWLTMANTQQVTPDAPRSDQQVGIAIPMLHRNAPLSRIVPGISGRSVQ
jgi:hypothetical protein